MTAKLSHTSADLRRSFLDYFRDREHKVVASSSLVPDDPTLLFTNAGMVQFKDAFLGLEKRAYSRATSVQKCLRVSGKHNDLEAVGPSPRHHTFFEMLGNFSFGDYFKSEAIAYAWEYLTQVAALDESRLVVTVHRDDSESARMWREQVGLPESRILRMGDKTNLWMMADVGPCGPTTEIHFDFGPSACTCGRADCSVALDNDCARWLEVWNVVFMQFNQDVRGVRTELPSPGVDTGMGLERLCAAVRETPSTYATDLFAPIIEHIRSALGHAQARDEYLTACRVVADHSRAMAFLIAEGVLPGNEGRDYVLRLIMRRAMRYGQMIGLSAPFLGHVTDVVCDSMGEAYPSLQQRKDWIKRVVSTEEERFARTLELGRIRQNEFAAARAAQASALAEVADLAAGAAAQCDSPQGPHLEELAVAARNLRDGIEAAIELPGPVVTEVKAAVRALVNYAQAALQEQPNATALRDELDMIRERLPTGQAGLSGLAAQAVESLWPLLGGLDAWSGDQADRAALFSRLGASLGDQLGRLRTIPGDEVFRLYDTYGFPPELTRMLAAEYGLEIDQEGFEVAMQQQRERARAGQKFRVERAREAYLRLGLGNTEFVGYDTTTAQATVVAVLVDGVATDRATPGSSIEIVLDRSPFYAEAGGQIGDTGELRGPGGLAEVLDTQAVLPGLTVHRARVARASLAVGDEVTASVDAGRRLDIMCNHTATHLLHRALREVLGEHAQQRGSLVAPDRLRFDFAHLSPLTPDDIQRLEQRVNELIRSDLEVRPEHLPLDEARRRGAIMLFGEKYGDVVRMVSIDELSRELCGGTHLDSTGKIGHFVITSESAVGAGVRRVEAVTGRGADSYVRQRLALVEQMAGELGAQTAEQIPGRLASLLSRLHEQEALIQKLQEGLASRGAALIDGVVRVDGIAVLSARVDGLELDGLRRQTDVLRDRLGSAVVVLATVSDDKPQLVVAVTPDVVARGLRANDLVARLSPMLDGGGGGRPELAQAGGRDASRLDEALAVVEELVREWLQQA